MHYLHALFISEPEDTPDVTGVTFVIAPTALVTVRYHPVETFDLFSQKLCQTRHRRCLRTRWDSA